MKTFEKCVLMLACILIVSATGCAGAGPVAKKPLFGEGTPEEQERKYCKAFEVFAKPELARYRRLSVFSEGVVPNWSEERMEKAFKAEYALVFSGHFVTFIEKAQLERLLAEQAPTRKIRSADALAVLKFFRGSIATPDTRGRAVRRIILMVKIVDATTGHVTGSVKVAANMQTAVPATMCQEAVEALKAELARPRAKQ